MRKPKYLIAALVLVLAWAQAAVAGPTYDQVMKDKVVRAGIMTDSIPGAFYNDKKEWVGFDVDIAEEIAKRLGVKLERVPVTNKTRIAFVQQGRIDMSVANMTHKRERDKSIDFSITYFFDGQKILSKKGQFKDHKDFVGKKIATMQGTTSELNVKNLLKELGDPDFEKNVISFQKESECFQALRMGRVAGWSTDSTILLGYAAQAPGEFELVGDFFSDEPYGIGLPENDSAWRDAVNFTLQDMWNDGTYKQIYDKWYGPETPYSFPLTRKVEMWP
ncbi:amino acid ABC transporter substrate-binding protein [Desulfuromonas versatilis]|uniref:Amino acid ABC transporter substrate-binding protein n=1 Tax=Desulfuromonas versatilis TaxID=2802975 RepID=A0ABM8HS29_9BACT|nr:ABC transporter substrate-binding protein [Desulfuromonas versatilis]BCR05836.1 amino acid ABC transporter substrate-binding protein [Desulfuromonas versatilis]